MSSSFDYTVDTQPMANSIDSVSRKVDVTTMAVVAMHTAVIAAEKDGANKVCANVNRGFYSLMRSQISQKIANKQSRTEALLIMLAQQKRMLLSVKNNMQREYQRIADRYIRIFRGINKELETRIRQIDQPVFELVGRSMDAQSNRMNALAAWNTTMQAESLTQSQAIALSVIKHNAKTAIEQSAGFLTQLNEQRVLAQQVLVHNSDNNKTHTNYVPVAVAEYVIDAEGHLHTVVSTTESLNPDTAGQIRSTVLAMRDFAWQGSLPQEVQEEFSRLLSASDAGPRIKQTIEQIFQSSATKTL